MLLVKTTTEWVTNIVHMSRVHRKVHSIFTLQGGICLLKVDLFLQNPENLNQEL